MGAMTMKWWKPVVVGLSLTLAPGMLQPALAGKKNPQPKAVKMPAWTELAQKQPAAYDKATPEASLSEEQLAAWWKTFQDPKLDALIELSLKNNRDLQAAQARVEEARAQLGISKGEALPWLNLGGTYGRYEAPQGVNDKIRDMSPYSGMINPPNRNSSVAGLGIDASWEPDFFGRLKAKKQSAAHNLTAQHAALYSTWVTLSAETALNYVSLRTLQQDLDLLERHAALEGEKADLLQTNYNAGLISGYPLEAMRTQEQNTRAEIPRTRQSIQETLTRLSILTGTEPGQLNDLLDPEDLPEIDPELYHAIPANLMRQRPDIRAAEERLEAQIARSKEARAELKPRFTLDGFLGLITLGGGNLFGSGAHSFAIAPSFTFPLFHGGQLRQNVKLQDARAKEYQAQYENTVLKAAGEVQDAMTGIVQEKERKDKLTAGVDNAQGAFDLAENRFQAGLSDYQPVLDSERTLLTMKRQENRSRGQELADLIHLFKALGGGWQPLSDAEQAEISRAEGKDK